MGYCYLATAKTKQMKKLLLSIFVLILCLGSSAQNTYNGDFNGIKIFGKIKAELRADTETRVELLDKNDHDKLSVSFENNQVKIQSTNLLKDDYAVVVIYYKNLYSLILEAGAQAFSKKRISSDNFELDMGSGSDFDADVEFDNLNLKAGQGSVVSLSGTADSFTAQASTGADIDAGNFAADACNIKANTGANVHIKHCDNLNAKANTGSNISYEIEPDNVNKNTNTGGNISRRN